MSFLTLPDPNDLDLTKAVVSMWFRVPSDAVTAAIAQDEKYVDGAYPRPFQALIPLLMFGPQSTRAFIDQELVTIGSIHCQAVTVFPDNTVGHHDLGLLPVVTHGPVSKGISPFNNTYIGLWVSEDDSSLFLNVNLQTTNIASIFNYDFQATSYVCPLPYDQYAYSILVPPGAPMPTEVALAGNMPGVKDSVIEDVSWSLTRNQPEYYGGKSSTVTVTPDTWHHLLISWDISGSVSAHSAATPDGTATTWDGIDSASSMWVAFDDKNYTGNDLPADWPDGGPPNAIITPNAMNVADRQASINATYNLTSPKMESAPICIPSGNIYYYGGGTIEFPYHVEMAELQVFTGVTLDTSVETNRRLFIVPDKKGVLKPVNPSPIYIPIAKTAVGDPTTWEDGADLPAFVPPPSALDPSAVGSGNKLLGTPAIDFTKASLNWMMGRNLGSLKGRVVRTGKIKAYFPDPSIPVGD